MTTAPNGKRDLDGLRGKLELLATGMAQHIHIHSQHIGAWEYCNIPPCSDVRALAAQRDPLDTILRKAMKIVADHAVAHPETPIADCCGFIIDEILELG